MQKRIIVVGVVVIYALFLAYDFYKLNQTKNKNECYYYTPCISFCCTGNKGKCSDQEILKDFDLQKMIGQGITLKMNASNGITIVRGKPTCKTSLHMEVAAVDIDKLTLHGVSSIVVDVPQD